MIEKKTIELPSGLIARINDAYRVSEASHVSMLLEEATLSQEMVDNTQTFARSLVETVREARKNSTGIDSFLTEYALSSEEGIALMCLAEALLRVPDNQTIDRLIKDKLSGANWESHKGQSESFFVNATTWALMLTGKVLSPEKAESNLTRALMQFLNRTGEGVVRVAVDKAMRILSKQFVTGRTIDEAIQRAKKKETIGYRYSYDMLGEAAITADDAHRYFESYRKAIIAIGERAKSFDNLYQRPGISIKLSALHPRYQVAQRECVMSELAPKLLALSQLAKEYDIAMTIDAEESERLELSLNLIEVVFKDQSLSGWNGFGIAIQSYQKRAFFVLDWAGALARSAGRRMMVRLIKGAYWDSEIKKSQMQGLKEYPVFTRKVFTDVSFQACAKKILTMTDAIYPMFATHNAYSVAMIMSLVGNYRDFEFQCLHGMGEELYEQIVPKNKLGVPCRVYAPVGTHEDLLPYLVRRLLENGANSSFVNRIVDEKAPIETLIENPLEKATILLARMNQNIPLPAHIFGAERPNAHGMDLSDTAVLNGLQKEAIEASQKTWFAEPIVKGRQPGGISKPIYSPQNKNTLVGHVTEATKEDIEQALVEATLAFNHWSKTPVEERAECLMRLAALLEQNMVNLMTLACLEAGKTWNDGIAEVREAVDFCRYYALQAKKNMSAPLVLQGYTGELNELSLHPRGIVLCISPWNFPLAIFIGQVAAALATGNCVIAKPAEQTPLMAYYAVQLMLEAGIPQGVMSLLPGTGETVGAPLVADPRIKLVVFTGSTQTANIINHKLATRGGEIIPLIAETGGQNAMIVDSSALLEQVVVDALNSSFGSAGQRCSALRVIYVQDDVYPRFLHLLKGAMAELRVGNPAWLSTDVGPVIDEEAYQVIQSHIEAMSKTHNIIFQSSLSSDGQHGHFIPPTAIELQHISALEREIFGPVLHVIAYKAEDLDEVIQQVNSTGYGLTLGIHSRITETVDYIRSRVHAGNCYVNRNMIGAVVGLQPFGGEGLSGTGPKAGGPQYLLRFCHERTLTVDTTAAGGNASLMALPEEN